METNTYHTQEELRQMDIDLTELEKRCKDANSIDSPCESPTKALTQITQDYALQNNCNENSKEIQSDNEKQNCNSNLKVSEPIAHEKLDYNNLALERVQKAEPSLWVIGPNGTSLSQRWFSYQKFWTSPSIATRDLLILLFDHETLATRCYGQLYRRNKLILDPLKMWDIICCVQERFNCTLFVILVAISATCHEAARKRKRRIQKKNLQIY
ncbi:uncharacterized protein LOC110118987 [Ceratitis capitata]|uniref:uncharacterized protein LOC110118987 n=1 Tax=Ceratitis capitata TaxID=7213 RepID=UPI000A0F5764|nr:uncharacterized protein LOC110118987 [Ceratitis capitata]